MEGLQQLENLVASQSRSRDENASTVARIYKDTLARSRHIRSGNFTTISSDDLRLLFQQYNQQFFRGLLDDILMRNGRSRLLFRISPKLTRAGGKTTHMRGRSHAENSQEEIYEIAISSTLLFQTFADVERSVIVNGVYCRDRLEALQRVFEHELIHLVELLLWGKSSCSAPRFRYMAEKFFNHTGVTHQLVTQRERAAKSYGIHAGDRVAFEFEGKRHIGLVNRITKRATILVESAHGRPYSDGKKYDKYYIPLKMLEKVS
jgi:hypothetical protein